MNDSCFKLLGLDENATREQVQEAYDRKTALYRGTVYDEDPNFRKKKLKELKLAYEEACQAVENAAIREAVTAQKAKEEPKADPVEDPEKYMQQLYHKHLTARINRAAGIGPTRSRKQSNIYNTYKRNVMFFWLGIVILLIAIGAIFKL